MIVRTANTATVVPVLKVQLLAGRVVHVLSINTAKMEPASTVRQDACREAAVVEVEIPVASRILMGASQ